MLGIIGGMGAEASSLFYNMLIEKTPAAKDQDHMDLMMFSHASMPDRTAAILSGDEKRIEYVRDLIRNDIRMLMSAGCDKVAITCNTAHYFVNMLEEKKHVIHLISETVNAVKARPSHRKAAVLATRGTIKTRIYQDALEAAGIEVYIPSESGQDKIMSVIYDYVKKGSPAPGELWNEIHREAAENGCDLAILGCTELSLVARELNLDISENGFYIDSMDVLASKCVELYVPSN
ncbi:MAG: aspartate/glutamate racemase family protein [Lentihominibacter sp.]